MSQYVPNWDCDQESIMTEINKLLAESTLLDTPQEAVPSLQESLTELTWKTGNIAMHGVDERVLHKPISPWDKPISLWDDTSRGDGTLKSVVNQATCRHSSVDDIIWFDHEIADMVDPGATTVPFDPLVPCHDNMLMHDYNQEPYTHVQGTGTSGAVGCPTQLVSLGAAAYPASLGINSNTVEREILGDMELTLLANTISGQKYTKTSVDHYDSISHSRSQRKEADEEGKTKIGKGRSSISEKKKRAAAIHNEAERKRRERINQKMKALQDIVPNSSKTDKVSLLHTVTEYVKQLQEQVQTLCRMYLPLLMQHQKLQMSKKGVTDTDTNNINHAAALPPAVTPLPFMPVFLDNSGNCLPMPPTTVEAMSAPPVILLDNSGNSLSTPPMDSVMHDPFATLHASQPQPMTMDAYNRLVTMSQQMQHPPPSKN